MRFRIEGFLKAYWVVLGLMLAWALWASAATPDSQPTPPPPVAADAPTAAPGLDGTIMARLTGLDEDHLTFGLKSVPFLRDTHLFEEPLWRYLASLIYIFLAFYVSKLLDFLTRVVLKRWAERTETKFDDLLLELLNGPIKVVAFVVFLHVGLDLFAWPQWAERALSLGLKIVVAVSLTYLVLKLVDLFLGVWQQRSADKKDEQFHRQLFPIIRKSLKVFVIIVSFLVTAPHLGLNITGLIASLSIGGLAIGLAAQDTLANLFGAVAVLMDKPFHVGDRIQLDSVDGVVEGIGFRSTRVRNLDGHLVTIPNKTVGNATITNIARRPSIRTVMNFGVTYDTPLRKVERAISILETVFGGHANTEKVLVSFNKFDSSALNIMVVHWWNNGDAVAQLAGLQQMNLEVKRQFDAEGIEFAFPSQTVYLRQETPPAKAD